MGTNYNLTSNLCKKCKRFDVFHLGKSSFGWRFFLQYNDGKYYTDWKGMKTWLKKQIDKGGIIKDGRGHKISLNEFIKTVEEKQEETIDLYFDVLDVKGYTFFNREFS